MLPLGGQNFSVLNEIGQELLDGVVLTGTGDVLMKGEFVWIEGREASGIQALVLFRAGLRTDVETTYFSQKPLAGKGPGS